MHDLVAIGEVMLRLSIPSPARIETVRQLDVQVGGAEANVAAAVARLGLRAAWISAVPANAWGERIRRELAGHGIDCGYVRVVEGARVGVYFLEFGVAPRPIRVLYDRRDSAFAQITPEAVDWTPVRQARLVHLTGITPALGVGPRAVVERALREASAISFDLNYRAALWSPAEARTFVETVLPIARHVFMGEAEARTVFALEGTIEQVIDALARRAPKATIALLQGSEGSTVLADGRLWRPSRAHTVQVVDPVGAGDAYVAGFLWATMNGRTPQDAVDAGAAVAALKCSTWGDVALVDARDVADLMAGGSDIRR
ncbi:MAG TPA: sugar kinase [Methylomirabilota bacterium]|jgi:2-dehydro-3-deoxygluconokinase|nr:sugar kinase [Methylomirabilota bacterium]